MRPIIPWTFLVASLCATSFGQAVANQEQIAVLRADEDYRLAKLKRDIPSLRTILAEDFSETNQNGNTRNKEATLTLWAYFIVDELVTDRAEVTISGDVAVVKGEMTEHRADWIDRMLFTRVYVQGPNGWRLLSSMQFSNPRKPSYRRNTVARN